MPVSLHKLLSCAAILLAILFSALSAHAGDSTLDLTPEEAEYLRNKGELTILCDPHWPPYEFVDSDGKYHGLGIDYHALIAERIGIPIRQIITRNWIESWNRVKNGESDLVSLLNKTPRRVRYVNFTPILVNHSFSIVGTNESDGSTIKDFAGKTFAAVKGYMMEETLRRAHPEIRRHSVKTTEEALQAVADGKADATVTTQVEASHFIRVNNLKNLRTLSETPYRNELRLGVKKGDPILLSIMTKAVNSISEEDRRTLDLVWVTIPKEESRFTPTYIIGVTVGTLLLGVLAFWLMTSNRQPRQ